MKITFQCQRTVVVSITHAYKLLSSLSYSLARVSKKCSLKKRSSINGIIYNSNWKLDYGILFNLISLSLSEEFNSNNIDTVEWWWEKKDPKREIKIYYLNIWIISEIIVLWYHFLYVAMVEEEHEDIYWGTRGGIEMFSNYGEFIYFLFGKFEIFKKYSQVFNPFESSERLIKKYSRQASSIIDNLWMNQDKNLGVYFFFLTWRLNYFIAFLFHLSLYLTHSLPHAHQNSLSCKT